jgi:biofilm protein TabA
MFFEVIMIVDTLTRAERYCEIHPGFREAFAFLQKAMFIPGRQELKKGELIAISEEVEGRGQDRSRLEVHRRYIDIQYAMAGDEMIGWKPLERCEKISEDYQEEKDIAFYSDAPLLWLPVPQGSFAIFFPEDAHAPLAGREFIRKIVMKVGV